MLLDPVPEYLSQRDNFKLGTDKIEPSNQCFLTSCTMFVKYIGEKENILTIKNISEDEYQRVINGICITKNIPFNTTGRMVGGRYLWDTHNTALDALSKPLSVKRINYTKDLIRKQIDCGYPVVMGIDISNYLKGASGHIVMCVGYDENGLIFHDPYGDAVTGYKDHNGKSVHYSHADLQNLMRPNLWMFEVRYER
jgi:hypothetical protein